MRDNWQIVKLPLCLRQVKIPKKVPRKSFLEDGAYPIISQERDSVNGYWDEAEHAINVDRPLVAYGDHTQAVKYIDFDFVVGADGLKLFLTNDEVLPRYFYYYLRGNPVKDLGYARHYRLLKELDVHYPPLPEQERIVSILDKAFEGIDKAIAQTEQNLASARELFESYLNNIFTQKGDDWVEKSLSDIAEVVSGHSFKSGDFSTDHTIKSIKITNVGVKHFVNSDDCLPSSFLEAYQKYSIPTGSVVIALTRTIISGGLKVAIVPNHYNGALLNQRVAALKFSDEALRDYVYYFLSTRLVSDYVFEKANTLMQPNLSVTDLKNLQVPVPENCNYTAVSEKIRGISSQIYELQALYTQKLNDLKELKQSLLQQAFAGELTKEDAA